MTDLYLFSSTARDRYLQDSLDVLALPNGARVHYRYTQQWLASPFAMAIGETTEQYANRLMRFRSVQSIVFLVDRPNTYDHTISPDEVHFYPLRFAHVRELEPDGVVLHAYFELGEYVDWRKLSLADADVFVNQRLHPNDRPPKKFMSQSIDSSATTTTLPIGNATQSWEAAVSAVSQIPAFKNTVFYRVSGMREVIGPSFRSKLANLLWRDPNAQHRYKNLSLSEVLPRRPGYVLRSGHVYLLDISFFQHKDPIPPVKGSLIKPSVDQSHFTFTPQQVEVNFRYDRHSIPIVCKPASEDTLTLLRIELVEDKRGLPVTLAPQINLPFRITYPRASLYIGFVLILVAQILIALSGKLSVILKKTNLSESQQALVDPLLAVGGAVITAVTLFVLFRRLPGTPK